MRALHVLLFYVLYNEIIWCIYGCRWVYSGVVLANPEYRLNKTDRVQVLAVYNVGAELRSAKPLAWIPVSARSLFQLKRVYPIQHSCQTAIRIPYITHHPCPPPLMSFHRQIWLQDCRATLV